MRFLDHAVVHIRSGNGGDGLHSVKRTRSNPLGSPDGGNGGCGGDVIAVCNPHLNTLIDFRKTPHVRAQNGAPGQNSQRHGKNGKDSVIPLPPGTQILPQHSHNSPPIAEILQPLDRVTLARGGVGGLGNASTKLRRPSLSKNGAPGQSLSLLLQLKLLADAGVVGAPNAGKSSLLRALSNAKPRVADYPFTTLHPYLGLVSPDHKSEFVLADVPGLIPGAAQGAGLGAQFLAHVERCRVLVHLVDAQHQNPDHAYHAVRREIAAYNPSLPLQPEIVALSKCDALSSNDLKAKARRLKNAAQKEPILISSFARLGLNTLLNHITRALRATSS